MLQPALICPVDLPFAKQHVGALDDRREAEGEQPQRLSQTQEQQASSGTDLPQAEQLAKMGAKRGVTDLPPLPGAPNNLPGKSCACSAPAAR